MSIEAPSALCLHLSDVYQKLKMESKWINSGMIKCSVLYHCRTNWRKINFLMDQLQVQPKSSIKWTLLGNQCTSRVANTHLREWNTITWFWRGVYMSCMFGSSEMVVYKHCISVFLMDKMSNPMSCFVTGLWLFLALIHLQRDVTWCKGVLVMFNHVLYFHTYLHKWEIGKYWD
jgi:hypothetical protein